jgi:outer membrane protein assembly factor BamB
MRRSLSRSCLPIILLTLAASAARADDWPQWLGPKREGVWRETGIVVKFPSGGPKVLWRTPIGGGYSGPAVAGERVYVMDRQLGQGVKNPENPFAKGKTNGVERVLCLDAADGTVVWKHEYDCYYDISYPSGPRCTPTVHEGKVYALGGMGDLHCLDAAGGKVLWSKNFVKDYKAQPAMWGWASHPLVDGDKVICIVGGKGTTAVAFHKDTGKELWRALSVKDAGQGYAPPMIYEAGGKRQLIIWHPESVNSLNPENGQVYWTQPFRDADGKPIEIRSGMTIPTPRQEGDLLFLSCFYNGSLMLKLATDKPDASVVWRSKSDNEQPNKTDTLHAVMCTPWLQDGHIYGVCSYGELRCLKIENGERLWQTRKATTASDRPVRWANAFIIPNGDRFFLANELGDLIIAKLSPRGYDEIDRAHLLEPTSATSGRDYVWSHPAFANRCVYMRNDKEIICVSLAGD